MALTKPHQLCTGKFYVLNNFEKLGPEDFIGYQQAANLSKESSITSQMPFFHNPDNPYKKRQRTSSFTPRKLITEERLPARKPNL